MAGLESRWQNSLHEEAQQGPPEAGFIQGPAHYADTEKPPETWGQAALPAASNGLTMAGEDLGPWLLLGKTHLLLMAESNTHGIFVAPRTRVPSLLFPTPAEKGKHRCWLRTPTRISQN